jgi:hypothetical protein
MALDADDTSASTPATDTPPDAPSEPLPVKRGRGRPRNPRPGEPGYEIAKAQLEARRQAKAEAKAAAETQAIRDDRAAKADELYRAEHAIERDAKGRILPGQVLNKGGLSSQQLRTKAMLDGLTPAAVARLEELMQSPNEQVALGAIREVMLRTQPAPPKTPNVAVQVNTHLGPGSDRTQTVMDKALARIREAERRRVLEEHGLPVPPLLIGPPVIDLEPTAAQIVVDAYQKGEDSK